MNLGAAVCVLALALCVQAVVAMTRKKLLTGDVQVERVTSVGTHEVPDLTLIGSRVIPRDID